MQEVEAKDTFVWLKDFYAPLLTERQREILNLYLDSDCTLSEIADIYGLSRQAIFDIVKRSEKLLISYEEKLGLLKRFQIVREKTEQAASLVDILINEEQKKKQIFKSLDEILTVL